MLLRAYTKARVGWADLRSRLRDRLESERGAVAAEYALLITLIALVIIIGAGALGVAINNQLNAAADALP